MPEFSILHSNQCMLLCQICHDNSANNENVVVYEVLNPLLTCAIRRQC